jgi:hypothetical protein
MAKRQQDDIRRWAMMGAEARLVQIAEETTAIHRAFPQLRRGGGSSFAEPNAGMDGAAPRRRRRRRKLSAEARKRISDAQKARWARQKGTATKKK